MRALILIAALVVVACVQPPSSPRDERAVPVAPIVDATCIFLRLAHEGRVDEVCARAEELAPYVPDIIADRADGGTEGASLAFGLSDPCKRRRRKDAGADAWDPSGAP